MVSSTKCRRCGGQGYTVRPFGEREACGRCRPRAIDPGDFLELARQAQDRAAPYPCDFLELARQAQDRAAPYPFGDRLPEAR